jgi:hypothetical protein
LDGGKIVERQFNYITPAAAVAMLALNDTEMVRNSITQTFEMLQTTHTPSMVTITDSLFNNEHTLDSSCISQLFTALAKDVEALPLEVKYFPQGETHAVISFPRIKPDGEYEQVTLGMNFMTATTATVGVNLTREHLFSVSTNVMRLFITDEYVNTLAFLNERGILQSESLDTNIIQSVYVERYALNSMLYPAQALYFRSYVSGQYDTSLGFAADASEYANLLSLARTHYYIAEGGYLVRVLSRSDNGMAQWVTLFLPEADAPDFIKN